MQKHGNLLRSVFRCDRKTAIERRRRCVRRRFEVAVKSQLGVTGVLGTSAQWLTRQVASDKFLSLAVSRRPTLTVSAIHRIDNSATSSVASWPPEPVRGQLFPPKFWAVEKIVGKIFSRKNSSSNSKAMLGAKNLHLRQIQGHD